MPFINSIVSNIVSNTSNIFTTHDDQYGFWLGGSSPSYSANDNGLLVSVIPCEKNTTYAISLFVDERLRIGCGQDSRLTTSTSIANYIDSNFDNMHMNKAIIYTTSDTAEYLYLYYWKGGESDSTATKTLAEIQKTIKVIKLF